MKRNCIEPTAWVSSFDLLPNDVIWLIFLELKQNWIVRDAFGICRRWYEIVRTRCISLDTATCHANRAMLQRLPCLRTLNLRSMGEIMGENDFACLSSLTALVIDWQPVLPQNVLRKLPDTITTLSIQGNYYLFSLTKLSNLRVLNLFYNSLVDDELVSRLTTLQTLNLSSCVNMTGRCLSTLSSLRSLVLSAGSVNDDALYSLVNLTSLDLSWSSNITNRSIARLTGLRDLTLRHASKGMTEDSLVGLHLLTRLCVHGKNTKINYSLLTQLKSLEIYTDRRIQGLTTLTTLVTLRTNIFFS